MAVDCEPGIGELRGAPAADFNESQAVPVQQNQINLATAGAKVTCNGPQTLIGEKSKSQLLGVIA